jgi:SAM-dependent methyltransferase
VNDTSSQSWIGARLDVLACPACKARLLEEHDALACASCGAKYRRDGGVVRFVTDDDFYEGAYLATVNYVPDGSLKSLALVYLFNTHYLWYVRRYVPSGSRLLELGCGGGVRYFARHARATGIDLSYGAVQRLDPGYELALQASALDLPIASGSYDAVVSAYFWEHIGPEDRPRLLSEVARVLKPGGRVVFLFDAASQNPLYRWLRKDPVKFREDFIENDHHYGLETATENFKRFEDAGFRVLGSHLANKTPLQHLPPYTWARNYGPLAALAARAAKAISSRRLTAMGYAAFVTLFDDVVEPVFPADWARIMIVALEKR